MLNPAHVSRAGAWPSVGDGERREGKTISARTLVSALRTAFYGALAGVFALSEAEAIRLIDGVVLGAILADYITWFVRSVARLPSFLLHGCYDAAVNVLFGWYLFRTLSFDMTDDGTSIAVAFVTFMLVLGGKTAYYAVQDVRGALGES